MWPAFGGQIQFGCSRVGDMPLVLRLLPALVIVSIVGLIDDIFSLRPWIKLTAEAVAAALAWFGGIEVSANLGSDFVPNGQP
jgi:UDP-N-acetylmuramyl pentapeptide phosphotransferase/UDP-N-acetylglucosamine-1-phosphate transferase